MRSIVGLRERLEVEVRVDLGAGDAGVAQELLNGAKISRRLQQMRSKRVAQHVRMHVLAQALLYRPRGQPLLYRTRGEAASGAAQEHRVGIALRNLRATLEPS